MTRFRNAIMGLLLAVGLCAGAGALAVSSASPAQAHCTRSISTSGNNYSVVITVNVSCGISHRAWLDSTDGKTHYGTYTKVNGNTSTACVNTTTCGGGAGTVIDGGWQRKDTGFMKCTFRCTAHAHTTAMAARSCTDECISWQYRGTHNPPDFRAEWVTGNSGGWFLRGVAHCADGRNEQLELGGWVTSLNIWSEAHCQSPYLDEIGGAYDLKTCSTCAFTRHWKVGHARQPARLTVKTSAPAPAARQL